MSVPFGSIFSGTLQTNPSTSVVLVTTGNLPAGQYLFNFNIASTSNTIYNIELLNAADSIIQTTIVRVAANDTFDLRLVGAVNLLDNYEMRIRPRTSISGGNTAVATITVSPA